MIFALQLESPTTYSPDAIACQTRFPGSFLTIERIVVCWDQVEKLRAEVRDLDARILEAETLLRFADPENYFRTGTRAAAEARSRGLRQHAAERQRAQEEVCNPHPP